MAWHPRYMKLDDRGLRLGKGHRRSLSGAERKWIHRCVGCGKQGLTPEIPADHVLRRTAEVIELDESGYCAACRSALNRFVNPS